MAETPSLTLWQVARRPRWIAALVFALAVSGVFGFLAAWQWERSIADATVVVRDTEVPRALVDVATPQSTISTDASGRLVTVTCTVVPSDDLVATDRVLPEGRGSWLIRHCLTAEGNSLALVAGWTEGSIDTPFPEQSGTLTGRYVPTESPQSSDFENGQRQAIAVPELVNLWESPGPVYGGYLVLEEALPSLKAVSTDPPETERSLNWLNVFYALEWVIFAGFALYFWYRVVRDQWEREMGLAPAWRSGSPT